MTVPLSFALQPADSQKTYTPPKKSRKAAIKPLDDAHALGSLL